MAALRTEARSLRQDILSRHCLARHNVGLAPKLSRRKWPRGCQNAAIGKKVGKLTAEIPDKFDAETWQSLSEEQRVFFFEEYGFDGQQTDDDERRKRLAKKYSDVLIQQHRAEVTTQMFVEAGQVRLEMESITR